MLGLNENIQHIPERTNVSKEDQLAKAFEVFKELNIPDAISTARDLLRIGFHVFPYNPKNHRKYYVPQNDYGIKFSLDGVDNIFYRQNIMISLGKRSRNLFMLICNSSTTFDEFITQLGDRVKWVSDNGKRCIWLLCEDGVVNNYSCEDYDINGYGDVIIPPSILSDGSFCTWFRKEGMEPPSISGDLLKTIVPEIKIFSKSIDTNNERKFRSPIIRAMYDNASNATWEGRTRIADKKVFLALLRRADFEKLTTFRASIREISEMESISLNTVRKSIRRLIKKEFIQNVTTINFAKYYAITFTFPEIPENNTLISINFSDSVVLNNHDAFRRQGLKNSGELIYAELLKRKAKNKAELSRRTGMCYRTITNGLERLLDNDLIFKDDMGYFCAKAFDQKILDEIARSYETDGSLENDKSHHVRERQELLHRQTRHQITLYEKSPLIFGRYK